MIPFWLSPGEIIQLLSIHPSKGTAIGSGNNIMKAIGKMTTTKNGDDDEDEQKNYLEIRRYISNRKK